LLFARDCRRVRREESQTVLQPAPGR
jgi:hypothetical protein